VAHVCQTNDDCRFYEKCDNNQQCVPRQPQQ